MLYRTSTFCDSQERLTGLNHEGEKLEFATVLHFPNTPLTHVLGRKARAKAKAKPKAKAKDKARTKAKVKKQAATKAKAKANTKANAKARAKG